MTFLLREPRTLLVIFVQPLMLLLLYGYAITFDLYNLPFAVLDEDRSEPARALVRDLNAGGRVRTLALAGYVAGPAEIEPLLAANKVRFVLVIPRGFGADITAGKQPVVQALFDAADSNTAGVAAGYLAAAIGAHNARLASAALARAGAGSAAAARSQPLDIRWRVFYNPDLSSHRFIIPGLIAILLSNIAGTLTATTITRERELGSLESLLTSPVGAMDLLLGKMLPYLFVAAGDVILVLVLGGLVFGVWPRGDLLTLASFSLLFLVGMLAMGLLISASAPTQLLALLVALTVTMLPNFFLTGFAFPRSNMPWILQVISEPLPATQYLIALRGIFLKGTGWADLWKPGLWMGSTAVALFAAAVGVTRSSLARGLE
jgi:ABC-2 type transport system permease protein